VIDWETFCSGLKDLIGTLAVDSTTVPEFRPQWFDEPAEVVSPDLAFRLDMKVSRIAEYFQETRYSNDGDDLLEREVGSKDVTVTLTATGYKPGLGMRVLDRIGSRIRSASTRSKLLDLNASLLSVEQAADISTKRDGRLTNIAARDLVLSVAFESSETGEPTDYIASLELTGHLTEGGTELPTNVTDELIPQS
jgi:hypothetical protein